MTPSKKSDFYKRTRNLFNPASQEPYRLSRSRLENFLSCSRCFYLDRRLGVEPPGMPPFTLNSAVDELLKKEFDIYRKKGKPHPLMEAYQIEAIPFAHPRMSEWRETFKGIQHHHRPTNLIISGAVDDIWIDKDQKLYVVDYKSTSTNEVVSLEGEYRQAFKRQMEIYQWLLRNQNFEVSDTGYFVYCNADKTKDKFDGRLEFDMTILSYRGNADWVEPAIQEAHQCLMSDQIPEYSGDCKYCLYLKSTASVGEGKKRRLPFAASHLSAPQADLFE